jgi:lipopolysaccharide/colanic/teichoic acid biosynthesis glycosyltransferase
MSTAPIAKPSYHLQRPFSVRTAGSDEDLAQPVVKTPGVKAPKQFAEPAPASQAATTLVTPLNAWYLPLKRGLDVAIAAILVIATAPVMVVAALLVKLTSSGPALFRQVRVGKDGRLFTLRKLRTMRNNAEAETGPTWSTENDVRITPLGKLLRRTHIDEFPQLWNVLAGDMSLIGPRPERPEFVDKLDWEIPFYRERLRVPPGSQSRAGQQAAGVDGVAAVQGMRRVLLEPGGVAESRRGRARLLSSRRTGSRRASRSAHHARLDRAEFARRRPRIAGI